MLRIRGDLPLFLFMTICKLFLLYYMKIKEDELGKTIHRQGRAYLVEDTEAFYKIAKAYGFDVFEEIKPDKKKRKEVEEEIKKDIAEDLDADNKSE